jgi:hypothetical protein
MVEDHIEAQQMRDITVLRHTSVHMRGRAARAERLLTRHRFNVTDANQSVSMRFISAAPIRGGTRCLARV